MFHKYFVKAVLILILILSAIGQEKNEKDTCLLVSAQCIGQGGGNFYLYYKISDCKIEIKEGDRLEYDIFLYPDQPELKGGIDIQLGEGASLRDSGAVDQAGITAHGDAILNNAKGQWYHRVINLSHLAGHSTERWDIQFEGDKTGFYIQFIDNVIVHHKDATQIIIYRDGQPSLNIIDWKEGYSKSVRVTSVPRSEVKEGKELKELVDKGVRLAKLYNLANEQKEELGYIAGILEREKQINLLKAVNETITKIPDPEKFEGSAEDYLEALNQSVHKIPDVHSVMQRYTGHLVGHAHIDFQWLWEWPETIQICEDTFGQAVKFMEKYPDFTFSQSSAALYLATEKNHPELFKKMQEMVKKGQWEIVGGRWCEGDNNIISGESHARQFLYGQRYFREKFGVTAKVGWEPDTFGHNWTMPQLLRLAGIDTYYFCRAGKNKPLSWWEGPDGSRVLAFEEPAIEGGWYNGDVTNRQLNEMIKFYDTTGSHDMLWVYGVGNHGGGPTMENIKTASEWQKKTNMSRVKFSTATAFFDSLKKSELKEIPVVRDELNSVFEGCYTTHSDMKRWNRDLESLLVQAETIATIATSFGYQYPRQEFLQTWCDLLWNHHHDTMGGTCIHAAYNLSKKMYERGIESMRKIINESTEVISKQIKQTTGDVLVFNTLGWARDALVSVKARDGIEDGYLYAVTQQGEASPVQRTADGNLIFVARNLPPFGYRVYHLEKRAQASEKIKVDVTKISTAYFDLTIDPATGAVTRILDKKLGREILSGLANELKVYWEPPHGMTAWEIGNFNKVQDLTSAKIAVVENGPVYVRLQVKRGYEGSVIMQDIFVYRDMDIIEFALDIDWKQKGTSDKGNPFLKTNFVFNIDNPEVHYSIPFGDIVRPMNGKEVPALQWADMGNKVTTSPANKDDDWGVALLNDCKHGYSANGKTLTLSLVRSSYDPDTEPDIGRHIIRYGLYPHAGSIHQAQVTQRGFEFNNSPVAIWVPARPDGRSGGKENNGKLPQEKTFLKIAGALPTALKLAEDSNDWIVRFYESTGQKTDASIEDAKDVEEVNLIEDKISDLNGLAISLRGYEIKTIKLKNKELGMAYVRPEWRGSPKSESSSSYREQGKYCVVDYSTFPDQKERAKEIAQYFDSKYPEVEKILKTNRVKNYPSDVIISFTKEDMLAAKYTMNQHLDIIKMNPQKVTSNNKGVLIHEGVHIAQSYAIGGNNPYWWMMEGLADYVRLKLGWDNPQETPSAFQGNATYKNGYQVAGFFLEWLESMDAHHTFIPELNKLIKEKCAACNQKDIDDFFKDKFGKTPDELWEQYKKEKNK
ncbi:MAG: glycoside hydrolase family 38 C-terminal domain-containing protein [Planctomycetota bacterium]